MFSGLLGAMVDLAKGKEPIDIKGRAITAQDIDDVLNWDYEQFPSPVFVSPREKAGIAVVNYTRTHWDWPREHKMKDKKWWRRRNKKLWRMQEEEKRLIQEAYDKYDRELSERFRDDDMMHALHYAQDAMIARATMSDLEFAMRGYRRPGGLVDITSVGIVNRSATKHER